MQESIGPPQLDQSYTWSETSGIGLCLRIVDYYKPHQQMLKASQLFASRFYRHGRLTNKRLCKMRHV
jgi:hypothetical protein